MLLVLQEAQSLINRPQPKIKFLLIHKIQLNKYLNKVMLLRTHQENMSRKLTPPTTMESTHTVFVSVIILAQCFGMFPVSGVRKDDHRCLHFKWRAFKVYFSLTVLCLLFINCGFQVYTICVSDSRFISFGKYNV